MPIFKPEEAQAIESFLNKNFSASCSYCGNKWFIAKQHFFLSIPIGIEGKGLALASIECNKCHHVMFFNSEAILSEVNEG